MSRSEDDEVFVDGYRAVHGTQAKSHVGGVIEVPPADEQKPAPPAPPPAITGSIERREDGKVTQEGARKLSKLAAAARARSKAWVTELRVVSDQHAQALPLFQIRPSVKPFIDLEQAFYTAQSERLSQAMGPLGPAPLAVLKTAAHQHGASLMLFELASGGMGGMVGEDGKPRPKVTLDLLAQASKLADASRQSILAAWHIARLEAMSLRDRTGGGADHLEAYMRAFEEKESSKSAETTPATTEPTDESEEG